MHHGEIVRVIQAFEGRAEQGGIDACVELVQQASQIEGRLNARKGLEPGWVSDVIVADPPYSLDVLERVARLRFFLHQSPDSDERVVAPMSSSSFKFNERELQRFMETEAQSALNDLATKQARELDQLREQYTGHPVEEIKPALQRLFAADGGNITDPELSEWAQLISDGTRIEMNPAPIDWTGRRP